MWCLHIVEYILKDGSTNDRHLTHTNYKSDEISQRNQHASSNRRSCELTSNQLEQRLPWIFMLRIFRHELHQFLELVSSQTLFNSVVVAAVVSTTSSIARFREISFIVDTVDTSTIHHIVGNCEKIASLAINIGCVTRNDLLRWNLNHLSLSLEHNWLNSFRRWIHPTRIEIDLGLSQAVLHRLHFECSNL